MKRESDRRRDQRSVRAAVQRDTLNRARYRCEGVVVVPEVECRGGLDTDEIVLRSGARDAHLERENTQALCRAHHDWKHGNDAEAERRGLRLWSYDCPDLTMARTIAGENMAAYLRGER